MTLPIPLTLEPMEAELVEALPSGDGWCYEPKYDGFRCVVFRDGPDVMLQSRRQRPLQRFFPELAAAIAALPVRRFVMDGELVILEAEFDTLQMRLHPAASRIARLSREHPATFAAFDLLAGEDGQSLLDVDFAHRRAALDGLFHGLKPAAQSRMLLAPNTRSRATALRWLDKTAGLDGIVAKRLDLAYQPGRRTMLKYKPSHTVDCVVAGYYGEADRIEYLLLGLYDDAGALNYVGRCGVHPRETEIAARLRPFIGGTGFTGEAPGGPSRWSRRERSYVPLRPELVVEVAATTVTAGKFRHVTRLLRWRDDKAPRKCTMDQIARRSAA